MMWWNKIEIKLIPHAEQAYDTLGDYERTPDRKGLRFKISDTGDADYNFLIMIHELIECYTALRHDIDIDKITLFDEWFDETPREELEPGQHKDAPYRREHNFALSVEMLVAHELGLNWYDYEKALDSIYLKLKSIRDAKKEGNDKP